MAAMSRDDFIAMMTTELKRQEKENSGDLSALPILPARDVLRKLYFDFPTVSVEEILLLVSALEGMSTPGTFVWDEIPLCISTKFLENLGYLHGCTQAVENPVFAEAVGKLCTFVYLKFPACLLECDITILRKVFSSPRGVIDEDNVAPKSPTTHVVKDDDDDDDDDDEEALLSWFEITKKFSVFIKSATASVICPSKSVGGEWFAITMKEAGYIANLEQVLRQLGHMRLVFETEQRHVSGSIVLDPVHEYDVTIHKKFFESCFSASPSVQKSTLLQNIAEQASRRAAATTHSDVETTVASDTGISAESVRNRQLQALNVLTREIWLHYLFLCRDIIATCPALLDSWMPRLLSSMPSPDRENGKSAGDGSSEFPNYAECLRVLLCANVSSSLTAHQMIANEQQPDQTQVLANNVQAGARHAFRNLLDSKGGAEFSELVDVCSRMTREANDGGAEAASFLVDISSLYLDANGLHGAQASSDVALQLPRLLSRSHERLVETRALAVISDLFAAATALEAKSSLRTAVPKLLDFLSVAALQTPTTASYILRLPATLSFLRVSTAHLTSAPHSEVAVQPVQLIPLLLGLLRASGISASVTSELESMLCVVAGITVTRITTAIEAQQAAAEADDDEEREAQDPAGVSRLRKAMTVPGLARCLQLITLPQSGGVAALQSIAAIQPVSATSASIRLIATEAGKLCAGDMKRLAKSTLSFLDGHGASKVD